MASSMSPPPRALCALCSLCTLLALAAGVEDTHVFSLERDFSRLHDDEQLARHAAPVVARLKSFNLAVHPRIKLFYRLLKRAVAQYARLAADSLYVPRRYTGGARDPAPAPERDTTTDEALDSAAAPERDTTTDEAPDPASTTEGDTSEESLEESTERPQH